MNVLIAYGTTEGQTRKICEQAAARLRNCGHAVELDDSADPTFHVVSTPLKRS